MIYNNRIYQKINVARLLTKFYRNCITHPKLYKPFSTRRYFDIVGCRYVIMAQFRSTKGRLSERRAIIALWKQL